MGSLFDSRVYKKRRRSEFLSVSIMQFMRQMALNTQRFDRSGSAMEHDETPEITLSVTYRHSAKTSYWYSLKWVDMDGRIKQVESEDAELLGFRALQVHEDTQGTMLRERHGWTPENIGWLMPDAPLCEKCRKPMYQNKKQEKWCSNIRCPY